MNLRFPAIAAIVVVAAGTAAYRSAHQGGAPAPFSTEASAREGAAELQRRVRPPQTAPEHIVVYVAGAVRKTGIYTLPAAARAIDAVRAAGGATAAADLVAINLAAGLSDGDEVAVPAIGDTPDARANDPRTPHRKKHKRVHHNRKRHHHRASRPMSESDTADASQIDPPASVVDLNTAGESELETLPGIGTELAERIVAFREATGPFATTDDLLDVAGITASKLEAMQPYITAGDQKESAP